jgi:hypothetical protein
MIPIALATCRERATLDEDGPALVAALRRRGVQAHAAIWDDPGVDWSSYRLVVLRSTWDYPCRWRAFLDWVHHVASVTSLANAEPVVAWNIDKRYLRELSAEGIPIVPTTWLEPDAASHVPERAWQGCDALVVKPAISAGSRDSGVYAWAQARDAERLAASILESGRPVLLQPYVSTIDSYGETALLYFGGRYSHAVRKGALLRVGGKLEAGLFKAETIEARAPSAAERSVGERVLDALPWNRESLLYARVDLVQGARGEPEVLELELIEPSVFLGYAAGADERFSEVIVRQVMQGDAGTK